MRKALVVGGANGIGLAISHILIDCYSYDKVIIIDIADIPKEYNRSRLEYYRFNLKDKDYSIFDNFKDINCLMITAGIGNLALFKDIDEAYIIDSFEINAMAPVRIISRYKDLLYSNETFYCGVMVSISAYLCSPFFSVYSATKASLRFFIEALNIELEKNGFDNRVLNISPGSIKGTSFYKGKTNLNALLPFSEEIVKNLFMRNDLFIPQYDEVFNEVLNRYNTDFREEGRKSYEYKINSGRLKN